MQLRTGDERGAWFEALEKIQFSAEHLELVSSRTVCSEENPCGQLVKGVLDLLREAFAKPMATLLFVRIPLERDSEEVNLTGAAEFVVKRTIPDELR